jgi:hypothetical protein
VVTRLKGTIHKAFSHRNYGSKFVVLDYNSTYFSNNIQKGKTCYSEEQVISKRVFNLSCGRVVNRVEKSKVLMEYPSEKDLDFRLSKRSLEFFKIHMS